MAWYLVAFLGGMVAGLIVGVFIDKDYVTKIAHMKVKGRGNIVSDNQLTISPKERREQRRAEREARRKARKKLSDE